MDRYFPPLRRVVRNIFFGGWWNIILQIDRLIDILNDILVIKRVTKCIKLVFYFTELNIVRKYKFVLDPIW